MPKHGAWSFNQKENQMHVMRNVLWMAVLMLVGCAQLGLPTPETFNERLAASYGAVTAARQSATTLLQQKRITAADAENILKQTDAARAGLDISRTMASTDLNAANARLNAVRSALTGLQTYLNSRSQ
jgi:hypothetical protein